MYLTEPQSSHFEAGKFEGRSRRENHFDWDLFYRFKEERERFWLERVTTDEWFRSRVEAHFARFRQSIDKTIQLLENVREPAVLDVGLSSESFDRALMVRGGAKVLVLDVKEEAGNAYDRVFGERGAFVLGDVISYGANPANSGRFDLVYSAGLIEHFPDKRDILEAHIALTKPGGVVLIFVPIDSDDNRRLTGMAAEWENFGYRELLTAEELRDACDDPRLDILASEPVGFFAAIWARKMY